MGVSAQNYRDSNSQPLHSVSPRAGLEGNGKLSRGQIGWSIRINNIIGNGSNGSVRDLESGSGDFAW